MSIFPFLPTLKSDSKGICLFLLLLPFPTYFPFPTILFIIVPALPHQGRHQEPTPEMRNTGLPLSRLQFLLEEKKWSESCTRVERSKSCAVQDGRVSTLCSKSLSYPYLPICSPHAPIVVKPGWGARNDHTLIVCSKHHAQMRWGVEERCFWSTPKPTVVRLSKPVVWQGLTRSATTENTH